VYLAYLDSINLFRPSHLRTLVYQQLLLAYFEHVCSLGYGCHFRSLNVDILSRVEVIYLFVVA